MARDRQDLNPTGTPAAFGDPPLTARPEGLLSLLGIQSGGRYPQTLSPTLAPTFELSNWYSEYNGTFAGGVVFGSLAAPALGGKVPTTIEVPSGEIWIVNRIGCTIDVDYVGAGEANWALIRTNNADQTELHLDYWQGAVSTSANMHAFGARARLPIILRPTVRLQLQYLGGTALTPTIALNGGEINLAFTRAFV